MKSKNYTEGYSSFRFYKKKKKERESGKRLIECQNKKGGREGGQIEWKCIKTTVCKLQRSGEEKKERDEKKLYCQNLLSSQSVSRKGSGPSGTLLSPTSRGATLPLFPFSFLLLFLLSPPFLSPSSPFLALSHPKSRVTAIYFASDPLYDWSRFAFMLDGLPKRLSDKAMNTLSGFSLLVSLRLAGQWCWY